MIFHAAVTKRFSIIAIFACLLVAPPCPAQGLKSVLKPFGGTAGTATDKEPTMTDQLAWVRAQLAEPAWDAEAALKSRLRQAGLPESRADEFRAADKDIRRAYQSAADLLAGLVALDDKSAPPAAVPPPADEEEAAEMREVLRRNKLAARGTEAEIEALRKIISQQQALDANAQRESRQLAEEAASAKTEEAKFRAALNLELAELKKRAASATAFFGKWKLYLQESILKDALVEQSALQSTLKIGGFDRQIEARRADKQLAAASTESAALDKETKAAIRDQKRAITDASALKENADANGNKSRAADQLVTSTLGLVTVMQGALSIAEAEKAHWQSVKSLAAELTPAGLKNAINQAEESIRVLTEWRPGMDSRLIEAREIADALQKQIRTGSVDPATRALLERALAAEQKRAASLGSLISRTEQMIALQEEFLDELQTTLGEESAGRRFGRAWAEFAAAAAAVWSFEIFSSGTISITVRKVVLAAAGFYLALLLAGVFARWIARGASRNFRIADDQHLLLEKSLFIPAAGLLVLTMLNWLNIPLTAFAFLGGAIAIGIGFGAQNLINNFISGIILLLERQIKVGDIIEVAGSTGQVIHLGSRCSRIRKFDGVEVLVPNSSFLEKEVTNWTLADLHHRFDFTVGAAYGSPVDHVISLLDSAVARQPEILRDPEPGVFFEAFGDSSLVFRIYYWIELGDTADARRVGSDLRIRIERDFRAAGIEIPFPQRDIHIRI